MSISARQRSAREMVRPFAMAGRAPDPPERRKAGIADVVDREQGVEIQKLLRPLPLGALVEAADHLDPLAVAAALTEAVESEQRGIGHQCPRRVAVRVLHEAAPDPIPLIAEADLDLPVGGQQQARVLEPAAGQHISPRAHAEFLALERPDLERLHLGAGLVRLDIDEVCVQQDLEVCRRLELAPVDLAEPGRRAVLPDPAHDLGRIERQHHLARVQPGLGGIIVGAELADRLRLAIVRLELGPGQGPAGEPHPLPRLEIERIERPAAPRPMVGRAAEEAQPRGIEIEIGQADVRALVKLLDPLLELEPAALEHADLEPAAGERARERDPGGAGADDRKIALQKVPVIELARIAQHLEPTLRSRARLSARACRRPAGGSAGRDRADPYMRQG